MLEQLGICPVVHARSNNINSEGRVHCTFLVLCLLVAFGAGGCATVVTHGFQTIAVQTDPAGADCTFSRDGLPLARVNPTPGEALVGKSSGALSLLCRKEGYVDAAAPMESGFQAMTLGNVLIGGIIGLVIDASTGAMTTYPDTVTITLLPHEFASNAARDAFFGSLTQSVVVAHEESIKRVKTVCPAAECDRQLAALRTSQTARLAEIEQRRTLAKVRPP
jgi:hypothetical protein